MGQFDSILWSSRNFVLSSATHGLGDCLHYNVSNSRQFQLELPYVFEIRPVYWSCKSDEVLEMRCWKLFRFCYLHHWPNRANDSPSRGTVVRVFFFRLAIFLKGFATREVEDCQELSFTHFDLEVVIRLKQKFVLPVASRLEGQITMYENLT